MGITVHWEGDIKDPKTIDKILSYAKFFAESLGWDVQYLKYPSIAYVYKIKDQNGNIKYSWITNEERNETNEKQKDAELGETEGIIINPKEPFNTESIDLEFYPYKNRYRIQGFCKTQVFSDKEIPNLIAHQLLISLLETIKNTWIPNLEIHDEGEFYKTNNYEILARSNGQNLKSINNLIGSKTKSFIEDLGDEDKENKKRMHS